MHKKRLAKTTIVLLTAVLGVSGYAWLHGSSNADAAASNTAAASNSTPIPLYDASTKLDPPTIIDTPDALITRVGDRVRDRHSRENMFHAHDHFVALYWINRTVSIEVVDHIAKGGKDITYNMTSLFPLNKPNLRLFFEGKGTVAQYTDNAISKEIDPLHYTLTITQNTNEHRPIKMGDRIESEFSPFLLPPVAGRTNYYGTVFLYVVGKPGMQPWDGQGPRRDSFPMPESRLTAGRMTLYQQQSDEPKEVFKQMATDMAPIDTQPFVLGRRLFHTDFETGVHSEPGNPIYTEEVGKLGPHFMGHSCISCHVNNSRALPPAIGKDLTQYVVHVGRDAQGTPHSVLGSVLQAESTKGGAAAEADVKIAGWTTTDGTYADGTPYSLQRPRYQFTGIVPEFFSIRIAPPIVGQGLMEAIGETDIEAQAAKENKDGIPGHIRTVADGQDGKLRLGRFGWKASQPRLEQQIASALTNDMGVTNAIYPIANHGSAQGDPKPNVKLDFPDMDNMYRYVATLGVPPRRDVTDPDALAGEKLFAAASCIECHATNFTTSAHYPLTEARSQNIHPYTDMLLHNMGPGLADNMAEGNAAGAEWRTPPLWGIGLNPGASGGEAYLHDGRARNLSEAILWHGGEAESAKEKFRNMSATDRAALIKFIKSL